VAFWRGRKERKRTAERTDRLVSAVRALSVDDGERVTRLEQRRLEIAGRCKRAPALARLLEGELTKLEKLVDDFLALSLSRSRCESIVRGAAAADLEAELRSAEEAAARAMDAERRELARLNLDVLCARRDKIDELRAHVGRLRAQLDLIENTFKLVADEVREMEVTQVTGGPGAIGKKLEEVLEGVELVRAIEKDRRQMLGLE